MNCRLCCMLIPANHIAKFYLYKTSVPLYEIFGSWGLTPEMNWGSTHFRVPTVFVLVCGLVVFRTISDLWVILSTVCGRRWLSSSINSNWWEDTAGFDNEYGCPDQVYRLWIEDQSCQWGHQQFVNSVIWVSRVAWSPPGPSGPHRRLLRRGLQAVDRWSAELRFTVRLLLNPFVKWRTACRRRFLHRAKSKCKID
jgi:hypothetical protein